MSLKANQDSVMVGDKVYSSMCQELRIDSIAEAEK
jgi:hypothetical protein